MSALGAAAAATTGAVAPIVPAAAAAAAPPVAQPAAAVAAPRPVGVEVAGDGLGVEGGRDLGRRMSIRLIQRSRPSVGGTPHRQFSKNS